MPAHLYLHCTTNKCALCEAQLEFGLEVAACKSLSKATLEELLETSQRCTNCLL